MSLRLGVAGACAALFGGLVVGVGVGCAKVVGLDDASLVEPDGGEDAGDGGAARDASGDAPIDASCTDRCAPGEVRCSDDAGAVETCEAPDAGCADFATTAACSGHRTCTAADAAPACACAPTACGVLGGFCADARTVATCKTDPTTGCLFVASTQACTGATPSCSGAAGAALCL